jgi:hypothetical protein
LLPFVIQYVKHHLKLYKYNAADDYIYGASFSISNKVGLAVVIGAAEDVNHLLEDELVEKEELQKTLLTPKICHLYRQEAHPRP